MRVRKVPTLIWIPYKRNKYVEVRIRRSQSNNKNIYTCCIENLNCLKLHATTHKNLQQVRRCHANVWYMLDQLLLADNVAPLCIDLVKMVFHLITKWYYLRLDSNRAPCGSFQEHSIDRTHRYFFESPLWWEHWKGFWFNNAIQFIIT